MISKEALEEFKKIWWEEYGEEISDELALTQATAFLSVMDKIYRPIKKDWLKEYGQRNTKQ
jgi:hypothetical protein